MLKLHGGMGGIDRICLHLILVKFWFHNFVIRILFGILVP
jgi:hypothetical protein